MAEEKDLQKAKKTYETLCGMLTAHDWTFEKDDDALEIKCGVQSEDLPMEISIRVDVKRSFVILLSHLPFVVSEDKRFDLAVAVSVVNNTLVAGSFDYDVKTGHMFFRMTTSFLGSELGEEAFIYMICCSCQTIDEYNDKFLLLAKNMMSLEQFISNN